MTWLKTEDGSFIRESLIESFTEVIKDSMKKLKPITGGQSLSTYCKQTCFPGQAGTRIKYHRELNEGLTDAEIMEKLVKNRNEYMTRFNIENLKVIRYHVKCSNGRDYTLVDDPREVEL